MGIARQDGLLQGGRRDGEGGVPGWGASPKDGSTLADIEGVGALAEDAVSVAFFPHCDIWHIPDTLVRL